MTTHKMKLVYIGAGADPCFLNKLDFDITIAVDPRPKTEFPTVGGSESSKKMREMYTNRLIRNYKARGFILTDNETNRWIFTNGKKTVIYHTNTVFPQDMNPILRKDIENYNRLLIKGFMPDKSILDMTCKRINVIGCDSTVYLYRADIESEVANEVDWELYRDPSRVTKWTRLSTEFNEDECETLITSVNTVGSIAEMNVHCLDPSVARNLSLLKTLKIPNGARIKNEK